MTFSAIGFRYSARRTSTAFLTGRQKKLIVVTFDHTVIELSYLVGTSAVQAFKVIIGGQNVDLPVVKCFEVLSHLAVQLFCFG